MNVKFYMLEVMLVVILVAVGFESTCPPTIDTSVITNLDKVAHFFTFGCVAWLIASVMHRRRWVENIFMVIMVTIVCVMLLGVADEYLQSFIPTRQADWNDVLADVAGGTVFLIVWLILNMIRN